MPYASKHNMTNTPVYNAWQNMRDRCNNKNKPEYHHYGGRGIKVCDRWLESFTNFYEDMGDKPTAKHTLERIDNDLGYSPDNCKWATKSEQETNKRSRTNTGEKYISFEKSRNRYAVCKKDIGLYQRFETLEQAIVFRDTASTLQKQAEALRSNTTK